MEQWNKLVGLVKEFYIAFGQQEFSERFKNVQNYIPNNVKNYKILV